MYKKMPLSYSFDALEPFIDTHTMGLHYNKHYANYLNKLNELLVKNNFKFQYTPDDIVNNLNEFNPNDLDDILFNLGGVLNHELYWSIISPNQNKKPVKSIKNAIEKKYGNFDNFKNKFIEYALSLKGSGYTFLVIDPNKELDIINTSNQITPYLNNYIPIMTIDMWEHAYYLNYKNNKKEYLENIFEILDFEKINNLYDINIKKEALF